MQGFGSTLSSPPEVVELLAQGIETLASRAVETFRPEAALGDEAGAREHTDVLRDRRAAHVREAARDRARGLLPGREKSKDLASPGLRQRAVRIVHRAISAQTYESAG